jgi:hypothetical protein
MKKYNNLDSLISEDLSAKKYFDTLPSYVKEQITTRSHNINSFDSLKDYAENLLRGDD